MDTRASSSNNSTSTWCTIESDPGVFTELIERIGVKDVQVEELYELSKETLEHLQPVYGLVFLFKWISGEKDDRPITYEHGDLFFANQVITNACATQAILSILLNGPPELDIGEELRNFKNFTKEFPPNLKGLAISNCELIRATHNSFARPEPFVLTDEKKATEEEDDLYHFISYIPFQGQLWELDGLKPGPICLGSCTEANWLEKAFPVVKARIDKYSTSEIRFNLMAVIRNRRTIYKEQLQKCEVSIQELKNQLKQSPENSEELKTKILSLEAEMKELNHSIQLEEEKFKNWEIENVRRKHNYIPFVFNLLKILGEKGKLRELIEKSQKK